MARNPIKDKKATGVAGEKEKAVHKKRLRGKAGGKSTATVPTRNTTTNSRGGNKPLKGGTAAQARGTANYLKRVQDARTKDAAEKAATKARKAGATKAALRTALKGAGIVGLAADAILTVADENKRVGPRTSKGGQMSRTKKK